MAKVKVEPFSESQRKMKPALDPETREKQLISLAYDRAEEQLLNGTASSQVITHFLKLGTAREQHEVALLKAKTAAIELTPKLEELCEKAIAAMTDYKGGGDSDDEYEDF